MNTEFLLIWSKAFLLIMSVMTILWIISIFIKNVSIVDMFWGAGFVITGLFYFVETNEGLMLRKLIAAALFSIWGLRLSGYLTWRNWNKGEISVFLIDQKVTFYE